MKKTLYESFFCCRARCQQKAEYIYMGEYICDNHFKKEETARYEDATKRLKAKLKRG